MTIFIDNDEMTDKRATKFISKPDDLARQIVRAWCQSDIDHCFESKERFKKAVQRNRKTLKLPGKIETLFTLSNCPFSTKAKDRKETLYFEDQAAKQTGRLRQQHRKGPLAKIDKNAKIHRFLSKKRLKFLKKWREQHHKDCLPCFYISEERLKIGEHHIEFAYDGKEVSGWHSSEGTVKTNRQGLDRRIASALENILGIRSTKIKK
jgi:hypothetical protein